MATQTAATIPMACYNHIFHFRACPVTCADQCPMQPKSGGDDTAFEAQRLREQADEYARKARWCFAQGYIAKGRGWRELAVNYGKMADEKEEGLA